MAAEREIDPRLMFKALVAFCFVCGDAWRVADYFPRVLEVHEIPRGPHRKAAIKHRAAQLLLCRQHHNDCGDYSRWPIVRQLALKKLRDPEYYDRELVNRLRHTEDEAITEDEVDAECRELILALSVNW